MSYLCHCCGAIIEEDIESFCGKCKPSADVVESIVRILEGHRVYMVLPLTTSDIDDRIGGLTNALAPIIEAEVERRVREYREALTEARNDVWRWERMHRNHSDDYAEVARLHSIVERCDKALSNGEDNANRQ